MADVTIFSTIGMTIDTFFTDTPGMGLFILANGTVLFVVVTSTAIHGKGIFIFRLITVMAFSACHVITICRGMGQVIENHFAAFGIEFHFTRRFDKNKILCIMTECAVNGTLHMTGAAIFPNTPLMDGFFLAQTFKLLVVVAPPAIGGKIVFRIVEIMVALFAKSVFKVHMKHVIKDYAAAFGIESHPPGLFLRLKSVQQDGNQNKNPNQSQ
jgi:hypothetical protein